MAGILLVLAVLALAAAGCDGEDPAIDEAEADVADAGTYDVGDQPADAAAAFVAPADGGHTSSPVAVEMAATGVDVVPADVPAVGEAHFHVLVDVGCLDDGEFFPGPSEDAEAEGYYHFGDGSSTGALELEPGTYELCLQLGDGTHAAFGDADVIEVTVD